MATRRVAKESKWYYSRSLVQDHTARGRGGGRSEDIKVSGIDTGGGWIT